MFLACSFNCRLADNLSLIKGDNVTFSYEYKPMEDPTQLLLEHGILMVENRSLIGPFMKFKCFHPLFMLEMPSFNRILSGDWIWKQAVQTLVLPCVVFT